MLLKRRKKMYASLKADYEAVRQVMLSHMDNYLNYAFEFSTIYEMIVTLNKWFMNWLKAKRQQLTQALYECKMEMNGSMRDHVVTMVDYSSQLRPLGVDISDDFVVDLILASFPQPFYKLVMCIRDTMEQRIRLTLAESRAGPPSKDIIDINVIDVFFTGINSNSWVFVLDWLLTFAIRCRGLGR